MMKETYSDIRPDVKISARGLWREASVLALVAMELGWIVPVYQSVSRAASAVPRTTTFAVFAGVLLLAYTSTRIASSLGMRLGLRRALSGALLLTCALLSVSFLLPAAEDPYRGTVVGRILLSFQDSQSILPKEFQVLVATGLLWTRGVMLAQRWIGTKYVIRSFQLGAGMFLLMGLFNARPWDGGLRLEVYLFLLAGLMAIGSAHSASLGLLRGRGKPSFSRTWVLSTIFLAVLIVGFSVILGSFASGALASPLAELVRIAASLLLLILLVLISPLLLVLSLALPGLLQRLEALFDFQGLVERLTEVLQTLVGVLRDLITFMSRFQRSLPDWRVLRPYLLWSVLLGLMVLLLRRMGRGWSERERWYVVEDTHDSLLEREGILKHIGAGMRRHLRQLADRLSGLRLGGRLLDAARIRRIYARMTAMAASLDHPRRSAQTPREYLPTLVALFPEQEAEVRCITEAYNQVRYGELPETRRELAGVEEAWRRVRTQGREKLKHKREAQKAISRWTDMGRS